MNIIYLCDLIGTAIFAAVGAIRGVRLKLDFLGINIFACVVGVGGGVTRDVILGATPVTALNNETYLAVCIVTGIVVFFTAPLFILFPQTVLLLDAFGLGVFTVIGAAKGSAYGLHSIGICLSGVVTAVGGGVIRDIMERRVPVILISDFYATASLIGGVFYCILISCFPNMPFVVTFLLVMFLVTGLRVLAIFLKLRLPIPSSVPLNYVMPKQRQRQKQRNTRKQNRSSL